MKSVDEIICFQEIPDEISLGLSISNCPNNCKNCHSPWLREDIGKEVAAILPQLVRKYSGQISCVLFMGGDDSKQIDDLKRMLHYCRAKELKTALYSGFDVNPRINELLPLLDYYKIGSYQEEKGALKSPTTNQRLYKKEDGEWKDITHLFWTSVIEK